MTRLFLNSGAALALLAALAGLTAPGDEGQEGAAPPPAGPFAHAARSAVLEITQPDKQLAWVEDIALLAKDQPGRFHEDGEHWVDSTGEFTWDDENEVYWRTVSAATLTRGRQDFVQFCASCHGMDGDGYGRSAQGLRPPPRSFKQSTFKFTKVPGEFLPNDEALIGLVRHGLDGTPMLKWAVSDERLHDILSYVKSLSAPGEGWHDETNVIGAVVYTPDDPWQGKEKEAIEEGRKAYHVRQCYSCHPAYATPAQINEMRGSDASTTYRPDLTYSTLKKDSSFEVLGYKVAIVAPDFTWNTLRYSSTPREAFQTIAAGISGAGMPTWGRATAESPKGGLEEPEIWAIAHYVRSLVDTYHGKPDKRAAFMASLRDGQ
jgi:mono/diheme cytochrome c family protein